MEHEQIALKGGSMDFARFLNYYGNFLGLASGTLEAGAAEVILERKPLFGFMDLLPHARGENWVAQMKQALREGNAAWNKKVSDYGSVISYSTDASVQVRVKAIREVIPALENAKNIGFAQDLGLRLPMDKIRSVLPAANPRERARYAPLIERQIRTSAAGLGGLCASSPATSTRAYALLDRPIRRETLTLRSPLVAIALCGSYNQTQQQQ